MEEVRRVLKPKVYGKWFYITKKDIKR